MATKRPAGKGSERKTPEPSGVRLQKVLAQAGLGSRRDCEDLITSGRVTVDGTVADQLGTRVDPASQEVRLDGRIVRPQAHCYYLVNKPKGYVCTNSDPAGRPRVIDLVPSERTQLFTVGRLDASSEGLILVTNDGELAQHLAHPRYHVPKVYLATVVGHPNRETLERIRRGVWTSDGRMSAEKIRFVRRVGSETRLEITLTEGRNRQVRRMLAAVGHRVRTLRRVRLGHLSLGNLKPGRGRKLTPAEVTRLKEVGRKRSS